MISHFVKNEIKGVGAYAAFLVFVAFIIIRLRDIYFVYAIDRGVMEYIVTVRSNMLTILMEYVTFFGDAIFIIPMTFLFTGILWWRKERGEAALLFLSIAFMGAVTKILKYFFARIRPFEFAIMTEEGFSFPSGHGILSLVFYGIVVYILTKHMRHAYQKFTLFFLGAVLVLMIGFSRVYLGVHWPTDIFASYLFGIAWLLMTLSVFEKNKKKSNVL